MKVIVAKTAGFCWGVSRAVSKARSLAGENHVYTDGPLIHNEEMIKQLEAEGITEANTDVLPDNSKLLIRAHGISPSRRAALRSCGAQIVDTTCPDVAKIQGLVKKHARLGYSIIIYGDKGHAEVTGLLGFTEGTGYVVSAPGELDSLPDLEKVCLVSQSTQFPACYNEIADAVTIRYHHAIILDTICDATKKRQNELIAMAPEVDVFVVVGGSHSANTVRLMELAKTLKPAFHIQSASQVRSEDYVDFNTAGLTAGASTPEFIIKEIKEKLESL